VTRELEVTPASGERNARAESSAASGGGRNPVRCLWVDGPTVASRFDRDVSLPPAGWQIANRPRTSATGC
jgi:hypothetical protein